jgi:hypothetical protein
MNELSKVGTRAAIVHHIIENCTKLSTSRLERTPYSSEQSQYSGRVCQALKRGHMFQKRISRIGVKMLSVFGNSTPGRIKSCMELLAIT